MNEIYERFATSLEAGDFEGAMASIRGVGDIMTKPDDIASIERALDLVFGGWIKMFPIDAIATVLDTSKWDAYPAINKSIWINYSLGWIHVYDNIIKEYNYQLRYDDTNNVEERMFLMRWFEDHKAFVHVCKKWYEITSGPDKTLMDVLVRMELLDILKIPTFSKMEKKCWEYYNADPDKEETGLRL